MGARVDKITDPAGTSFAEELAKPACEMVRAVLLI